MSKISKELSIFLVAGSIPIYDKKLEKYFNSSFTFNNHGEIVAKFNKIHLFDIDIPGKITFQESKVLSPGSNIAEFMVDDLKVGVGICFDVRFAELAQIYQRRGCNLLIYPGAFNMTTGPAHWELLCRARALDNQLYVAMCSPARDKEGSYVAYGHSMISDPYGRVVSQLDEHEGILTQEIDMTLCDEIRGQIPVIKNRRDELYEVNWKK
jgi:omega-amidase